MASQLPERIDYKSIPRWAVEKYPERQADMEAWYFSFHFYRLWEGSLEQIDRDKHRAELLARATAEAKIAALDNVLEVEQTANEVVISMLVDADRENWYRYAEVGDLMEFLHDKLEHYVEGAEAKRAMGINTYPGGIYEVNNLIKVISTLVDMGVPKEQIVPVRHNLRKAMYASGTMKAILESDLPQSEKEEQVMEILGQVTNPRVTVTQFLNYKQRTQLESVAGELPIDGMISILRTGEMIFVRSPDTSMTKAIQKALKGLVNGWMPTDAITLATQITDEISTKDKYRPTRLIKQNGVYTFIQGGEGMLMPTPERLKDLVMREIGHCKDLIDQVLAGAPGATAYLPVFRIGKQIPNTTKLPGYIREEFATREHEAFGALRQASVNFYELPEELEILYRVHEYGFYWNTGEQLEFGIRLLKVRDDDQDTAS